MTTGSINDRRRFTQEQLEAMASRPGAEHPAALRQITASMLGFNTVNDAVIAPEHPQLPTTATVIATLSNSYGPDYIGIHFDMTTLDRDRPRSGVTNVQVQAANDLAQRYAGEESYPLLIFTLPDNSGVQFVTGNPEPSNHHRLRDVVRVTAHWNGLNRTALDCLERVGNAIVNGDAPQRAFRAGFDIQPVTNEFFTDYKANYDAAVALMEPSTGKEQAGQFVQTMFNRLLFIHFISRKGWLKFNGDTDYLNALWKDYQTTSSQSNFYTDRLTALFFAGLNNPQAHNLMRDNPELCALIGEPPFLNGGLFEPTQLDDNAAKGDFTVPDEAIAPLITGLFNNYNFTVTEATPLDTEVAVDPEMLGKLFEETVNERHSNGAYYTPRPVVSFMCRESIKGYLSGKRISSLDDAKIANLVDLRNPDAITPQQALEIANAMAGMKVVDPACGSGAFLLGMLQEILALNDSLFRAGHTAESMYRQKLDIITNNIYGADKDGLAVSTAMLRLWLSLAVDYDGEGTPNPLPNLDLKLAVGDTIAGPNPKQLDFTLQSIVNSDLSNNIAEYTTARGQRKATLKQEIEQTKQALRDNMGDAAPDGVVEWRIDFADVMLNGGFDVVIANPPYVQLQGNGGELANLYKSCCYSTFARTGDVYQLFYERGCQLLRSTQGILAYITSNSWLKAEYGKSTRRFFAENHTPLRLLELGKDVFESAIVDSGIMMARHGKSGETARAVDMDRLAGEPFPPPEHLWGELRYDGEKPWSVLSAAERSVMDKMESVGTPLKEWDLSIFRGVTTGYNAAFVIDTATKEALIAVDPKSEEIIKPVLRGEDITRYRAKWAGYWLVTTFPALALDIEDYPGVIGHLRSFGQDRLEQSGKTLPGGGKSRKKTSHSWFEIQDATTYHPEFLKEKLLWMDMAGSGRFSYSDTEMYCNNKGYVITGASLKYLSAVLNSVLVTWFMKHTAPTTGMGLTEWTKVSVERVPIPKIIAAEQDLFIKLVDEILAAKDADSEADTEPLEWEIDRLVYDLYGLTEEEDTAIERSLGLIHQTDEEEDAAIGQAIDEALSEDPDGVVSEKTIMATPRSLNGG